MREKNEVSVRYLPTFVGRTENDEKVVLYRNSEKPYELHIRRPDGELWALGPGSMVFTESGQDGKMRMEVSSTPWTGRAIGTKRDLIAEPTVTK